MISVDLALESLEQGTKPLVCVHYCVWVKCRAQILHMGHHTWPRLFAQSKSDSELTGPPRVSG